MDHPLSPFQKSDGGNRLYPLQVLSTTILWRVNIAGKKLLTGSRLRSDERMAQQPRWVISGLLWIAALLACDSGNK